MSPRELVQEALECCPVCGCSDARYHDRVFDTLIPEINRYLPVTERPLTQIEITRVCCTRCGVIYLSPRLDAESLQEIYRLWYGYAYRSIFSDPRHKRSRENEFRRYHLRLLEQHAPVPGKLLDVGCGSGMFLGIAKLRGWNAMGIELDEETARWAKNTYGVDVRFGTLQNALEAHERFDVITMFDYLEHTDRPSQDLASVARHLKSGGLLVIRVPNQDGWQSRFMKQDWLAVICNHLTYFTPQCLTFALQANGFEVVESSARNYRCELDIFRQHWSHLRLKMAQRARSRGRTAQESLLPVPAPASKGRGMRHQVARLAHSLMIEQVDHLGGWFGQSNFLTVVARRT